MQLPGLPGGGRLMVRSAHHQALASAGPGWRVTARDADGLIEAIERPGPSLAIGVQWHPERADSLGGLFTALVAAARSRATGGGATGGAAPEQTRRNAIGHAVADAPRDVVGSS